MMERPPEPHVKAMHDRIIAVHEERGGGPDPSDEAVTAVLLGRLTEESKEYGVQRVDLNMPALLAWYRESEEGGDCKIFNHPAQQHALRILDAIYAQWVPPTPQRTDAASPA